MVASKPWDWEKVDEERWLESAEEVRDLLARWKEAGFSRVLDLGCGLGRHALLFARAGFSVTAYDLSELAIERLQARASDERLDLLTVIGDLRALPFRDEAFDCVLAYRSIYHSDHAALVESIGEVRRVLMCDGEFFANFLSSESGYYEMGEGQTEDPRVRMKVEGGGAVLPHCYLDGEELRSMLRDFDIRRLSFDAEPESPEASLYWSVLATASRSSAHSSP